MFDAMVSEIRQKTVRMIMAAYPRREEIKRVQVANPLVASLEGDAKFVKKVYVKKPAAASAKIGRNDPCPCGSGKKYKNCCGANPNVVGKGN